MLNKGLMSSESNEWYTPKYIVDFLEGKYGKITLDPCASEQTKIGILNYTKKEDGLTKEWKEDFVFVNPPYGREISKWVKKSYEEHKKYNNKIALLIPARPDTTYWHDYIFPNYKTIYFIKGRIKFLSSQKESLSAPFPSVLIVFDKDGEKEIKTVDFKERK